MAAAVLRLDGNGNPRTLRLFAALVEAESLRYAAATASVPSENDLVRAFRGGATPSVAIGEFLERLQRCFRFDGSVYVLAAAYLALFIRSRAARDAGILVEPATAHRLVSVSFLLGAKFASPRHYERRVEAIEICSDRSIRSSEMCPLECCSCVPSATASSSATKSSSGSSGSWSAGRQPTGAVHPGRGLRRPRRAQRSTAASEHASRPSWRLRIWI